MLGAYTDPSVDQALATALPTADGDCVERIAAALLDRGRADAAVTLIERFDQLPRSIREKIIARVPQLYGTLRKAANQATGPSCVNTIAIIRTAKEGRLAYLVAEQLRHRPAEVQQQAAEALLDLANHATQVLETTNQRGRHRCDPLETHYVRVAVEESVGLYGNHQQPATLLAMFTLVPRPMPQVMNHLANEGHPAIGSLRRLLAKADQRAVRRGLLAMVGVPTLTAYVLEGLTVATRRRQFEDVLAHWHLLLDHRVARPLTQAADATRFWPRDHKTPHGKTTHTRGLALWARCVERAPIERVAKLAELAGLTDPMARLSALRGLMALAASPHPAGANEAIALFCRDPNPGLARIALRHLIRVDWPGLTSLLTQLVHATDPTVRRLAMAQLTSRGFKQMWDQWPRISAANRLAMGRALIKINAGFTHHLGRKLNALDRASRLRAISIIRTLNQAPFFERALLDAARDRDEVIVSAAIKALGEVRSLAVDEALTKALNHHDSRVRANAIEALYPRLTGDHLRPLSRMAVREENRPQANAIAVLLRRQQEAAWPLLRRMLADRQPGHRLSALWLVGAFGLTEVATRVAEMSINDPHPRVRASAKRVVERLTKLMVTPVARRVA